MEGEENVDKLKDEIKNAVSKFIERRLKYSCELQEEYYSKDDLFDLDVYITLNRQYEKLLEDLYKKRQDGKEEKVLEKNGQEVLMFDAVKALRKNLCDDKIWKVRLLDENIEEIIFLVKRYFDIIDFSEFENKAEACNENFFLRGILVYIRDNDKKEFATKADRYLEYFCAQERVGFDDAISGHINIGYDNLITLSNADNKIVFMVNNDKEVSIPYNEEQDYFLKGEDIVFGLRLVNGRETLIPARKIIRDDKVIYNSFLYGDYDLEESSTVCSDKFCFCYTLKDLLSSADLEEYYESVYNVKSFIELTEAIRGSLAMSDENKEKLEEVSKVASDWWASVVFRDAKDKEIEYANKIDSFRKYVKLAIKKLILRHGYAGLSLDKELVKCVNRADIRGFVSLPPKTNMRVTLDEVTVSGGANMDYQTIVKRDTSYSDENGKKNL